MIKKYLIYIFPAIIFVLALTTIAVTYSLNSTKQSKSSTVDSTSVSEISTDEWITYQNTSYGIKFKYPETYKLIESKDNFLGSDAMWGIYLVNPEIQLPHPIEDGKFIDQSVFNLTLLSYFDNHEDPGYVSGKHIAVGDNNFYYYPSEFGMYQTYDYEFGDFYLYTQEKDSYLKDPVFYKILSSFELIEDLQQYQKVDTSTWKTYRDANYGIEFKYPFYVNGLEPSMEKTSLTYDEIISQYDSEKYPKPSGCHENQNGQECPIYSKLSSESKQLVQGVTFRIFTTEGDGQITNLFFEYNSNAYLVSVGVNEFAVGQLLSSFKFSNINEAATRIYTSEYGYQISIPNEIYINKDPTYKGLSFSNKQDLFSPTRLSSGYFWMSFSEEPTLSVDQVNQFISLPANEISLVAGRGKYYKIQDIDSTPIGFLSGFEVDPGFQGGEINGPFNSIFWVSNNKVYELKIVYADIDTLNKLQDEIIKIATSIKFTP